MKTIHFRLGFVIVAGSAPLTVLAEVPGRCEAALKSTPALTECRETGHGIVIGEDADQVLDSARYANEGERRFEAAFGRVPPAYAVVFSADKAVQHSVKNSVSASFIMPWITPNELETAKLQSIRRAIEQSPAVTNLSPSQREALIAKATSDLGSGQSARKIASHGSMSAGALPHELGHKWLMASFWSDSTGGARYGSPGPDWLDELAAVMCENETFAKARRDQFETIYRTGKDAGVTSRDILDLKAFLHSVHPTYAELVRNGMASIRSSKPSGTQIRIMTGPEADAMESKGIVFYLQSRSLADFLIERSQKPAVLGSITTYIATGRTFDQWLIAHGASNNLPSTEAGLQQVWTLWLEHKYGGPPPRPDPASS